MIASKPVFTSETATVTTASTTVSIFTGFSNVYDDLASLDFASVHFKCFLGAFGICECHETEAF